MEAGSHRSIGKPSGTPVDPDTPDPFRSDGKNKVQRIGSQTRGLFEDFKVWVELRLRLFQLDVQERIQRKFDRALIKVAPVVVGTLSGIFALVTAALFLGWALGHPAWGFLVVTGVLLLVTAVLVARSRRMSKEGEEVDVTPTDRSNEGSTKERTL